MDSRASNSGIDLSIKTQEYEIYELIGRDDKGVLMDLTRNAVKANDFKELDDFIEKHIEKYLYNNGAGKMVIFESSMFDLTLIYKQI
jgi:hypothetical protein